MTIAHSQIKSFAEDRINLPATVAQKHRDQVNRLRERLAKKISEDPDYGLVKMLHSGSVAKGTALSSVDDLDAAVYVEPNDKSGNDADLIPWLADRLFDANPNMSRDQFVHCDHCVRVSFRGSGLDVDVAPVLYEGDPDDRGYLVRKHTGERVLTSIPLHLKFIRKRKKDDPHFAQLIRITKWWKRTRLRSDADFRFKSFMLELLWAHLVDGGVETSDYPNALEEFFGYIVKTELEDQVAFTDYCSAADLPEPSDVPIDVVDPVNPENNVGSGYSIGDRDRIVAAAQDAFDAISEARFAPTKGRAVECWRVLLGPSFKG